MLKNKLKFPVVIGLILSAIGCEDILEEDITEDSVQVVHPVTNDTILGNSINFTWMEISGADTYRIRVQDDRGIYYLDSLVTGHYFITPFEPGNYQWTIRAENSAYETKYSEREYFTVLSSDDLRHNKIFLDSPVNAFYTNQSDILFKWQSNEFANRYRFQLQDLDNQLTVLDEIITGENNFSLENFSGNDGMYKWRVQALNDFSHTPFSDRIFYLDRKPPNNPTLSKPDDQFRTVFKNIDFSWKRISEGPNSEIFYGFEISRDNLFSNIIQSQTVRDTLTNYTFENDGTYYWRVKAIDRAGNFSDYSGTRSINLQ